MKSCQLQLNMISHFLSMQFCTHIFYKLCHAQLNRGSAQMQMNEASFISVIIELHKMSINHCQN